VAGYLVADREEILARRLLSTMMVHSAAFCVLLAAGSLLALPAVRYPASACAAGIGLLAVEFSSLATFALTYNPIIKKQAFDPVTPGLARLQQDQDLFRVLFPFPFSNIASVYGLSDAVGYDGMTPRHMEQLVDATQSIGALGNGPLRFTEPLTSPILDLLNVKYVLLLPGAENPGLKYRLEYDGPDGRIYRNVDVLPRAFLVPGARRCMDEAHTLGLIRAGAIDFRKEVILDGCDQGVPTDDRPVLGSPRIEYYEAGRAIITAGLERPAFLILSDTYFPGWQARVDGRRVPVLRANHALRAVALGPGSHTVEFVYWPLTFGLG
jgi:Bacterial membrane protein YfhO